ncbi:MAG: nucleotidyltransferase domain-containing protein [Desulfobacterales bacterium]|nr:nucleotidyltransferase domain-containing protein [Desulfobacterales bacterium]
MKKTTDTDLAAIISKVEVFAKAHPDIAAVYLFGSHATGHQRKRSDLDLGVLFHKEIDGFARIDLETELSNLLKKDVDLIDMRRSGPFLRHQIYKYGKLIYQDDTEFPFLFRAASIRDYLDTGHLREVRREYLYGER